MKMVRLVLFVSLIAASLFAADKSSANSEMHSSGGGSCAYRFTTASNQIVLPNGYFNNYIAGKRTSSPRYMGLSLTINQLDEGYIYCVARETEGKMQCMENLDELVDNTHIKFIGIDNKKNTYFLFKGNNISTDLLLPLNAGYVDKDQVRLTLLQYKADGIGRVCTEKSNDLTVSLKRFQVAYRIDQQISESNDGKPDVKATAVISNPDGVGLVVADLYAGDRKAVSDRQITLPLAVGKSGSAGFCLTMASEPDDESLKRGPDYFCRTITLSEGLDEKRMGEITSTPKEKYIQLAKCEKNQDSCDEPHKLLGSKAAIGLQKAGYTLKTRQGKTARFVVTGPFLPGQEATELAKIKQIVAGATIH